MDPQILMLRGVNVGGVKLPMAPFREALAGLGLGRVRSYIQSGNAVFDDPGLPDLKGAIGAMLKDKFSLTSALFLYTPQEFSAIEAACPYAREGDEAGAKVHVFFLAEPSVLDNEGMAALATTERFHLTAQAFYLHAPDGIGRSVMVEKLGRFMKATTTARNWNTVRALSEMAKL